MTNNRKNIPYLLPLLLVLSTVYILLFSEIVVAAAYEALKLCGTVIIPSLFPYMVISSMLVRTGAATSLGGWLARPVESALRLPGSAGGAIVLGALCGFPVGAKTACDLYEQKSISHRDCERLIAIANNTGPSFVIEVVGAHFWGSRGMGVVIYTAQILSAFLIGHITSRREKMPPRLHSPSTVQCDILRCLATSVSHSARSALSVCGFIVFFAVATSMLCHLLSNLGLSVLSPVLGAVLEFSTGAAKAAELGGIPGAFLTGFTVGWSGISVFAQCKAFTAQNGISLRFAAACKVLQGALCGIAAAIYYAFFFSSSVTVSTVIPQTDVPTVLLLAELVILGLASVEFPRRNT